MEHGRYGSRPYPNYQPGYPVYMQAPVQPHFPQYPVQAAAPVYQQGAYNQNVHYFSRPPPPNVGAQHYAQGHQGPPAQAGARLTYMPEPANPPHLHSCSTPPPSYMMGGPGRTSPGAYPWSSAVTPPSPASMNFTGKSTSPALGFDQSQSYNTPPSQPARPTSPPVMDTPSSKGAFPGSLLAAGFVQAAVQHGIRIQAPQEMQQPPHSSNSSLPTKTEPTLNQNSSANVGDTLISEAEPTYSKGFEKLSEDVETSTLSSGFEKLHQTSSVAVTTDAQKSSSCDRLKKIECRKEEENYFEVDKRQQKSVKKEAYKKKLEENCFWIPEDSEEFVFSEDSQDEEPVSQNYKNDLIIPEMNEENSKECHTGQMLLETFPENDTDIDIEEHEYLAYCDELSFSDDSCGGHDGQGDSTNSTKVGEADTSGQLKDLTHEDVNNNENIDTVQNDNTTTTEIPEITKKLFTKDQIIKHCLNEIEETETLMTDLLKSEVSSDRDIDLFALLLAKESIAKGVVKYAKTLSCEDDTDELETEKIRPMKDMSKDAGNEETESLKSKARRLYSWTYLEDLKERNLDGHQNEKELDKDSDTNEVSCEISDNDISGEILEESTNEEKINEIVIKPSTKTDEDFEKFYFKQKAFQHGICIKSPPDVQKGKGAEGDIIGKDNMHVSGEDKISWGEQESQENVRPGESWNEEHTKEEILTSTSRKSEDLEQVYFRQKASQHGICIKNPSDGQENSDDTKEDIKLSINESVEDCMNKPPQMDIGSYEPRRPVWLRAQSEDSDSDSSFRNRRVSGQKHGLHKIRRHYSEDFDSDGMSLEGSQGDAGEAFKLKASMCGIRIQDPKEVESSIDSEMELSDRDTRSNSFDSYRKATSTPDYLIPNLNPDSPEFRPVRKNSEPLDWVIPDSSQPSSGTESDKNSASMRPEAPAFNPNRSAAKISAAAPAFQPRKSDGNNNAKPLICHLPTPKKPAAKPAKPAIGIQVSPLMTESCVGTRRVKYKDTGMSTGTCDSRDVSVNTVESHDNDLNVKTISPRQKFVTKGTNTMGVKKRSVGLNVNFGVVRDGRERKDVSKKSQEDAGDNRTGEMKQLTDKVKNLQLELMEYKQREVENKLQDTIKDLGQNLASLLKICTNGKEKHVLEKVIHGKQEHLSKLMQQVQAITETTIAQINSGWVLNELPDFRSLLDPALWSPVKPSSSMLSVTSPESPDYTELHLSPDLNCSNNAIPMSPWTGKAEATTHTLSPKIKSALIQKTSRTVIHKKKKKKLSGDLSLHDSLKEMQTLKEDKGVINTSPPDKSNTHETQPSHKGMMDLDDSEDENAVAETAAQEALSCVTECQAVVEDMKKLISDKMNDEYGETKEIGGDHAKETEMEAEVVKTDCADTVNNSISRMDSIDSDSDYDMCGQQEKEEECSVKENEQEDKTERSELDDVDNYKIAEVETDMEKVADKCESNSVSNSVDGEPQIQEKTDVNEVLVVVNAKEVSGILESEEVNSGVTDKDRVEMPATEATVPLEGAMSDGSPIATPPVLSPDFSKEVFISPDQKAQSLLPDTDMESQHDSNMTETEDAATRLDVPPITSPSSAENVLADSLSAVPVMASGDVDRFLPLTNQADFLSTLPTMAVGGVNSLGNPADPLSAMSGMIGGGLEPSVSLTNQADPLSAMSGMIGGGLEPSVSLTNQADPLSAMSGMIGGGLESSVSLTNQADHMPSLSGMVGGGFDPTISLASQSDSMSAVPGMEVAGGSIDPLLYQAVMTQLIQAYPEMAVNQQLLMNVALQQTQLLQHYMSLGPAVGNTDSSVAGADLNSLLPASAGTSTGDDTNKPAVASENSKYQADKVEKENETNIRSNDIEKDSPSIASPDPVLTYSKKAKDSTPENSAQKTSSSKPPGFHSPEDDFGFTTGKRDSSENVKNVPPRHLKLTSETSNDLTMSDQSCLPESQKGSMAQSINRAAPLNEPVKCQSPTADFLPDFAHRHNPVNSSNRIIHSFTKKLDEQVLRSLSSSDTVNFERKTPSPPTNFEPKTPSPPATNAEEWPSKLSQQEFPALGKPSSRQQARDTASPYLNSVKSRIGAVPRQENRLIPNTATAHVAAPPTGNVSRPSSAPQYAGGRVVGQQGASKDSNKTANGFTPANLPPRMRSESWNSGPSESWDDEVDPFPETFNLATRKSAPPQPAGNYSMSRLDSIETAKPPARLPVGLVAQSGAIKQGNAAMCDIPVRRPSKTEETKVARLPKTEETKVARPPKTEETKVPRPLKTKTEVTKVTRPPKTEETKDGKEGKKKEKEEEEEEDWCQVQGRRKRHVSKEQVSDVRNVSAPYANPGLTAAQKKARMSNFDRLVGRMIIEFPYASRQDIVDAITSIRQLRGSLSGLSMESIIERAHHFISSSNAQKTIPGLQPQRPGQAMNLPQRLLTKPGAPPMTSPTPPGHPVISPTPVRPPVHQPPTKPVMMPESRPIPELDCSDDEICVICHDPLSSEPVKELDCYHVFHSKCIGQWVERERTCPTCRQHALFTEDFPRLGK